MNLKSFAVIGLVAFPMLVEAKCGWVLIVPPIYDKNGPGIANHSGHRRGRGVIPQGKAAGARVLSLHLV